jgi:hypothetical protein
VVAAVAEAAVARAVVEGRAVAASLVEAAAHVAVHRVALLRARRRCRGRGRRVVLQCGGRVAAPGIALPAADLRWATCRHRVDRVAVSAVDRAGASEADQAAATSPIDPILAWAPDQDPVRVRQDSVHGPELVRDQERAPVELRDHDLEAADVHRVAICRTSLICLAREVETLAAAGHRAG